MKNFVIPLVIIFLSCTLNAQVLYTDNFNNHTIGNLGTDTSGTIPGQGGWLTHTDVRNAPNPIVGPNTDYQITAESNKGNILKIKSFVSNWDAYNIVFRTDIDQYWQQRTAGNNVLKFSFDYYSEGISPASFFQIDFFNSNSKLLFGYSVELAYDRLNYTIADKPNSYTASRLKYANGQLVVMPKNTWITLELYVDYNNSKVYYSVPSLNYTVVFNMIALDPNGNGDHNGIPKKLRLHSIKGGVSSDYTIRIDNINISAQNTVPALSTNNVLAATFNLYPNPATNVVNITNSENILVQQVTIYDTSGKQLSTQTFNNEAEIQLNIENLASGLYMLHIQTNEGTAVKQLVKK
jgi:hypothetical protein